MPSTLDVHSLFRVDLRDLGEITPGMEGIWIPEPEIDRESASVTRQFLDDAENYHKRYANVERMRNVLGQALDRIGFHDLDALVLDLGAGSGRSVLPCLEILPECRIVAVDISPNMLRILRDYLDGENELRERVAPVCMSATSDLFRSDSFGLVTGVAILHHLMDPAAAILAACGALKEGGSAIFFEPFELGNGILRLAYSQILERRQTEAEKDAPGFRVIEALETDLRVRAGADKSIYKYLDDKWLFTRAVLEELGERAGFSDLRIDVLDEVESPFTHQTRKNLRHAAGLEVEALPEWAWNHLACFDQAFSEEVRRELLIEGCITFTK